MEILFFMFKLLNYNAKNFEISWQAGTNYIFLFSNLRNLYVKTFAIHGKPAQITYNSWLTRPKVYVRILSYHGKRVKITYVTL